MSGTRMTLSAIALAFAVMAMPISAAAISSAIGPQPWGNFSFGEQDSFADACTQCDGSSGGDSFFLETPPWTLTSSDSLFLIVQDAFISGDQFRVFDGPTLLGDTSVPGALTTGCFDPDICFSNDNYSQGIFSLAAGAHSFTIQTIASPFGGGEAFFCISTSRTSCSPASAPELVPEPTSLLLLGLGLCAGLYWIKRPRFSEIWVRLARNRSRRKIG